MLVPTKKEYDALLEKLRKGPAVTVYDLETTGLDPFGQDRLAGVALLIPDMTGKTVGESFYAPFRHAGSLFSKNLPMESLHLLAPFLGDPDRTLIGFNLKFDVHFTEADGMAVRNRLVDVMLAAHLANENEMSFALKSLAAKYVDPNAARENRELQRKLKYLKLGKGDISRLPPEEVAPYAEQDVIQTWKLARFYTQNLEEQGISHLWGEINDYLGATIAMERRGVLVDPKGCKRNLARAKKRQAELYEQMVEKIGRHFNPNSVPQLRRILGQHLTGKEALRESKHPIAKPLLEHRAWVKADGTFYRSFLDRMDDGHRIHPSIFLHGTISGRPSCRDPNLQALPKKKKSIYKVREQILAPPGYVLVSWDWDQVELRLLAHYTKDSFLVDAFQQKKDIHQEIATMLSIPRDSGKRINFGSVYGVGADTLSKELHIPRAKAEKYLDRYHHMIPGIRKLYHRIQRTAEFDRKIKMWTGRLRHYRQEDATHKAMSNLIQGGVAEMMRVAITRLHHLTECTHVHQVLQVHDEILFEIPIGREAYWAPVIKDIMEDFKFDVPIVAEGKMGYSWGTDEMRPIKFDKRGSPIIPKLGRRGT